MSPELYQNYSLQLPNSKYIYKYWQMNASLIVKAYLIAYYSCVDSPSYNCVSAIVWLHHLDFNEILEEKTRWELRNNFACCV